jgi:hypothetical protein
MAQSHAAPASATTHHQNSFAMMLFLRINVANRILKLGNAGAENCISVLPRKRTPRQMIVDP